MLFTRDGLVGALMMVVCLGFIGYIAYERLPELLRAERTEDPLPVYPLPLEGAQLKGDPSARVAVIVYSDFICAACARLALLTMPTLEERYVKTGQALVALRHFPRGTYRPLGYRAAEAAACAGEQGRFWPMHDAIFQARADGREYGRSDVQQLEADLRDFSARIGLDSSRFEECLRGRQSYSVFADAGSGAALGISGTPTILVGVVDSDRRVRVLRHFRGRPEDQVLFAAIDNALETAGGGMTRRYGRSTSTVRRTQ